MDLPFYRQIFILISTLIPTFSSGFMMAFPGVLNPSLLDPNSTDIRATMEQASWIAASNALAGIPGFIILPIIMQTFGRRVTKVCLDLCLFIGWIIFFFAKSMSALFAARIIQGFAVGCIIVTSVMMSEYCQAQHRGYFMVLKKIMTTMGVLLCHVFALFWTWRTIAGFCIFLHLPALIMTVFWPESPAFLAMKGRFEDCAKAHAWVFGTSAENLKDVNDMIAVQRKKLQRTKVSKIVKVKRCLRSFLQKDFLKAFLISILLTVIIEACGRHYFMAYIVQITMELINDKTKAVYVSIVNDSVILAALLSAGIVIGHIKRRSMLLRFGAVSVSLMFLISILLILKNNCFASANVELLSVFMIFLLSFVCHIGAIPAAYAVYGEVFSIEHRGAGTSITGLGLITIYASNLKLSPIIIRNFGLQGMFFMCASLTLISLVILYLILPETKDRSLQEIEIEMKGLTDIVDTQETNPVLAKDVLCKE